MKIRMFKAIKQTKRFRKNQKVWIVFESQNYYVVCFKWRGKSRKYVSGILAKMNNKYTDINPCIGEINEIDISDSFCKMLHEVAHIQLGVTKEKV